MENLKNEFCSELIRLGFKPEEAVRALSALAIVLKGYTVSAKEANIAPYNGVELIARLIKLYVDCKRVENCSPAYCKNIELLLPKFFEYIGKGPKETTSFDVRAFLAQWQIDHNVSGATMDKYRQHLSCFFAWLVQEGYITNNPCINIKKIKQETKEREALTQMELEIIRASLIDARERMLVELLYSTACRASEVVEIKLKDIDLDNGTVALFGKGKKHRTSYLNAKAIFAIKKYLAERPRESEYLFCSLRAPYGKTHYRTVESVISKINERVKDKIHHKLHPHLFRHTSATTAINNGLPVPEIQILLGHSNIATTMIYAKTDKSQIQADHAKRII